MSGIGQLYNAGLINRGNVTIWIDEALLHKSSARTQWYRLA
ncbi:MAG: hypothetical protein E5299_01116 [Burkholderia gladioli]|nr:MAG: hypothetical protein E5299_01116 [Burkholderia gladioli]